MLMNMKSLLAVANQHNFAIPAFNTPHTMIMRGIIEASEEMQAPVIIEVHPDELTFARTSFITSLVEEANKATVPVCIHLDHGSDLDQVITAIQCGYTSVMIDASSQPLQKNIEICKEVCRVAHAVDVSVEGELGTIGTAGSVSAIHYTDPEEAAYFVKETGVDTLAVAIGTRHGIYPQDMVPELRLDLLDQIKKKVHIPLVLHGGSSNKDSEIQAAVDRGINKINISSDIKDPFYQKCREILQDPTIREPNEIYPPCIEAMKDVIRQKFQLMYTDGKAVLY